MAPAGIELDRQNLVQPERHWSRNPVATLPCSPPASKTTRYESLRTLCRSHRDRRRPSWMIHIPALDGLTQARFRRDRIRRSPNGPHSPMRPRCQCDSVPASVTSTCCRSRTRRVTLGAPRRRGDLGNALARLLVAALKARGNAVPMRGLAMIACVRRGSNDSRLGGGGFRSPISGPRLYADRHPGARRRIAHRPDRVRPGRNGRAGRRPWVFRNPSGSR